MATHKKRKKRTKDKKYRFSKRLSFLMRISIREEKEYFMENLGMLFGSGMDVVTALQSLRGEMRSPGMHVVIDRLEADIDAGVPIWQALKNIDFLPEYIVSLVRVGEETGRLSENLKVIVAEREKARTFRSKINAAMIYPALVFSLTFVIGIAVAWFILPRLATVFDQLSIDLPFITRVLIELGSFLGTYGVIVIPAVSLLFLFLFLIVFILPRTRIVGQVFLFHIPQVKKLIREVEIARMGFVLGTLLDAGVPIVFALSSLRDATQFYAHKRFYTFLRTSIEEGNSFKKSFVNYKEAKKLIPAPVQEMIITGERSGTLPETFMKVGETFEAKTEITTKNMTVILEPILLVIVWLGVVSVALAVILPIYSLIGGFQ